MQRRPEEKQQFQMHELVEIEDEKDPGPLKVILLEDIEGIGLQFDVVEVDRKLARNDLLLNRKAVYASPFDLQYYAKMREKMKVELEHRIRIPYEHVKLARRLIQKLVPFFVSKDNAWTVDKELALAALRKSGIYLNDEAIFLPKEILQGPNLSIESKLFRFYLVSIQIEKRYIVPMLGRICHCSSNDAKIIPSPDQVNMPSDEEMKKHGLCAEDPYYHSCPELDEDYDVFGLMASRSGTK